MIARTQSSPQKLDETTSELPITAETEKVLCQHCLRTATNGIKCLGKCVADSDY